MEINAVLYSSHPLELFSTVAKLHQHPGFVVYSVKRKGHCNRTLDSYHGSVATGELLFRLSKAAYNAASATVLFGRPAMALVMSRFQLQFAIKRM